MPFSNSIPRLLIFFLIRAGAWGFEPGHPATVDFLDRIGLPSNPPVFKRPGKVVIAIVDDGFRLSHRLLKDHIHANPGETAGNGRDDDGNTYIDDVHGWDISDRDSDVTPSPGKLAEYYHGTHIAGILMEVLGKTGAGNRVEIMPVKVLSDMAEKTYLVDGYKGIRYAAQAGADIILCAWGLNVFTPEEAAIVKEAQAKGAWIVAAAGNFNFDKPEYPASFPNVIAVGALDSLSRKSEASNFGGWVDISAPGTGISGADAISDTGMALRSGTSTAAPIVAAAMALLKLQTPDMAAEEMERCLKAGSDPIDHLNPAYAGKLGAGRLDIQGALAYAQPQPKTPDVIVDQHPEGYLRYPKGQGKAAGWRVQPEGRFPGLWFKLQIQGGKERKNDKGGMAGDDEFKFTTSGSNESTLFKKIRLADFPESLFVPSPNVFVTFKPRNPSRDREWILKYKAMTLDSSALYCRDQVELNEPGQLTDGSGPNSYSAGTSCKWLITAPPGKVVHFKFKEMDTEVKTDMLYFFDGSKTNSPVMAIYTGHQLPPELTSWSNQVLLWFVTNSSVQGNGWTLTYDFRDATKK